MRIATKKHYSMTKSVSIAESWPKTVQLSAGEETIRWTVQDYASSLADSNGKRARPMCKARILRRNKSIVDFVSSTPLLRPQCYTIISAFTPLAERGASDADHPLANRRSRLILRRP